MVPNFADHQVTGAPARSATLRWKPSRRTRSSTGSTLGDVLRADRPRHDRARVTGRAREDSKRARHSPNRAAIGRPPWSSLVPTCARPNGSTRASFAGPRLGWRARRQHPRRPTTCQVAEKLLEACSPALIEHQDLQGARKVGGKLGVGGVPLSTGEPTPTLQNLLGGGSSRRKRPSYQNGDDLPASDDRHEQISVAPVLSSNGLFGSTNLGDAGGVVCVSFALRAVLDLVRSHAGLGMDPQPAAAVMVQIRRHPEHPKNVCNDGRQDRVAKARRHQVFG